MMVMQQCVDNLDEDQWETIVSVHSPVVRSDENGISYTTYAVSIKSDNCCFSQPFSCVQRRYSEFVRLKYLLKAHHPNIDPPPLPPKKYFSRFDQPFISERIEGLQEFLKGVLDVPVYLSNKAVHLFLQSVCSMTEIDAQVSDNIPAAKSLKLFSNLSYDCSSDASSDCIETGSINSDHEQNLSELDDACFQTEDEIEIAVEAKEISNKPEVVPPEPKLISEPIPILHPHLRSSLLKARSVSPRLSPSTSSVDSAEVSRRVSFCNKVKVALVCDEHWNIGTRPIRSCAW